MQGEVIFFQTGMFRYKHLFRCGWHREHKLYAKHRQEEIALNLTLLGKSVRQKERGKEKGTCHMQQWRKLARGKVVRVLYRTENSSHSFPLGHKVICVWKKLCTVRSMSPLYPCHHFCSRTCLFRIFLTSFLVVRRAITGSANFG